MKKLLVLLTILLTGISKGYATGSVVIGQAGTGSVVIQGGSGAAGINNSSTPQTAVFNVSSGTVRGQFTDYNVPNTSAITGGIVITSTGTSNPGVSSSNPLLVTDLGTQNTYSGIDGSALINCSPSGGDCLSVYKTAGVEPALTGALKVVVNNTANNEPVAYFLTTANTAAGNSVRLDGAAYPAFTLVETSQVAPAGKEQMSAHNDQLRFESRNAANNSFVQDVIINPQRNGTYLAIQSTGSLRLMDVTNTNYVGFAAPASPTTLANPITWTLPPTDGTNGQVMQTNGSQVLSWVTSISNGIFTPTVNGAGTITAASGFYQQIGNMIHCWGSFKTGTVSATTASMSVPVGSIVYTNRNTTTGSVALGWSGDRHAAQNFWSEGLLGVVFADGSDTAKVYITTTDSTVGTATFAKQAGNGAWSTGEYQSFDFWYADN